MNHIKNLKNFFLNFIVPDGSDYTGVSQVLEFGPDSPREMQVSIAILLDNQVERDETFSVTLTASEGDNDVIIGRDEAQITIVDENSKLI